MARSLERPVRNLDFLRPRTRGKFLFAVEDKFYVRGVTYGSAMRAINHGRTYGLGHGPYSGRTGRKVGR